jgi:hypothetical protein
MLAHCGGPAAKPLIRYKLHPGLSSSAKQILDNDFGRQVADSHIPRFLCVMAGTRATPFRCADDGSPGWLLRHPGYLARRRTWSRCLEAQSWAQSKYPWTRRLNARRLRIAAACERDQSIRSGVITRAGVYMDFKTKSAGT